MNHGEEYPWIAAQFDHAPIVAATAVFTSLRSDIVSVETLASQTILGRVKALISLLTRLNHWLSHLVVTLTKEIQLV